MGPAQYHTALLNLCLPLVELCHVSCRAVFCASVNTLMYQVSVLKIVISGKGVLTNMVADLYIV